MVSRLLEGGPLSLRSAWNTYEEAEALFLSSGESYPDDDDDNDNDNDNDNPPSFQWTTQFKYSMLLYKSTEMQ